MFVKKKSFALQHDRFLNVRLLFDRGHFTDSMADETLKKIHLPDENTLLDSRVGVVCVLYCHRFGLSFCQHFALHTHMLILLI